MPLDQSYIGRVSSPFSPYEVSREKVREFATAIGEFDPVCRDVAAARAAGHPDLIAPPTFPAVFVMPQVFTFLKEPDLGWQFEGTVHGGQIIEFQRPIHAGDELVSTIEILNFTSRAGTNMVTLKCACTDTAGELVCSVEALLLGQADEA